MAPPGQFGAAPMGPGGMGMGGGGMGMGGGGMGGGGGAKGQTRNPVTTLLISLVCCFYAGVGAQMLSGPALVKALQGGGHVIVMRHASSPGDVPQKPNPDNVPPERQLDEKGRISVPIGCFLIRNGEQTGHHPRVEVNQLIEVDVRQRRMSRRSRRGDWRRCRRRQCVRPLGCFRMQRQ